VINITKFKGFPQTYVSYPQPPHFVGAAIAHVKATRR